MRAQWVKIASGMPVSSKKNIECIKLPKGINPAALLFNQALEFYHVFCVSIGRGVHAAKLGDDPFYLPSVGVCLTILHFSIELMLKSLISLKEGRLDKKYAIHD